MGHYASEMEGSGSTPEVRPNRLDKVVLPDNHHISKCWHPHYHQSPFKPLSAKIFFDWNKKEFTYNPIRRAAPLCVFGGASFSPYVLRESASGTYAVCPSCEKIIGCGYNDNTGLGPRSCEKCAAELGFNDYFQPVLSGSNTQERNLIDPSRDPAVTIAETCALAPEGINIGKFPAIIAILTDESLLKSGKFVQDLSIHSDVVTSDSVVNRLMGWRTDWIFIDTSYCNSTTMVKLSKSGTLMLKARKIVPLRGASSRVHKLLALPGDGLQRTAWKALANKTTR
ncbi:MAG: hypothetical protein Q7S36_01285 [Candidatus Liptonbacteria bacterium]|nr:hypothetical protein [Candidatus Liptonbacteria bacterium]